MDVASVLREARQQAGLSQVALAERAGTSQATISAYESGRKQPSVDTLQRLLDAMGLQLTVERVAVRRPSAAEHERTARELAKVLRLAEALPARQPRTLQYPRLNAPSGLRLVT